MNLLIVDSDQTVLSTTASTVQNCGHTAFTARNLQQADRVLEQQHIHAIILDRILGTEDGIAYMENLFRRGIDVPVIISTVHTSIESTVEAMRKGAHDYLGKPFTAEQIRDALISLERFIHGSREPETKQPNANDQQPAAILESKEPLTKEAFRIAFKAARSEASILLMGGSGTGKSILARLIHQASPRKSQPFVEISCPSLSLELLESELFGHLKGAFTGAIKDTWGKVHSAEGGTLFLDEIGELPNHIQPKLLRLLQDGEYERVGEAHPRKANVRIITATHRDLQAEVSHGRFREDLYYRLAVIPITLPSLAERPADLAPLAKHFLRFFAASLNRPDLRFSPQALQAIQSYGWPGNLREMRNVIERATILCEQTVITDRDLALDHAQQQAPLVPGQLVSLREMEAAHIRKVIENTRNYAHAAEVLQIDTATLYRKRKQLRLT